MTSALHWLTILPEIFLLFMLILVLLTDLYLPEKCKGKSIVYGLSVLTTAVLSGWYITQSINLSTTTFSEFFVADPLANVLKAMACLATMVTFIYSKSYLKARNLFRGDFFILALFSLLGLVLMISANHLLSLYLGLELMSLSLYAVIALWRESRSSIEAAMKYYVLGALASGFLLYGLSMLYGATGTLALDQVFKVLAQGQVDRMTALFALIFILSGTAFKLGVVPFHMWVPDVYQGAPTPMTLLVGAAPKLGAFALLYRLLIGGLLPLAIDWQQMLIVLAALSLIVGNFAAIAQTNLKRMLAYSTIAHMGFVLLGVLSGIVHFQLNAAVHAYGVSMFYILVYVLTTLGTFGIIMLLSRQTHEAEELNDLKGLSQRSPWFALMMLLFMFSLAGIPPLAGFYVKLTILQALLNAGHIPLAILAVLTSLVGAFYYLRIVKLMYFDAPTSAAPLESTWEARLFLSANGLALIGLGFFPGSLLNSCVEAVYRTLMPL